tara:strand:+ start:3117 stop:4304 length:1188 start_codon:yes stop_codon:yes gene_type:complete
MSTRHSVNGKKIQDKQQDRTENCRCLAAKLSGNPDVKIQTGMILPKNLTIGKFGWRGLGWCCENKQQLYDVIRLPYELIDPKDILILKTRCNELSKTKDMVNPNVHTLYAIHYLTHGHGESFSYDLEICFRTSTSSENISLYEAMNKRAYRSKLTLEIRKHILTDLVNALTELHARDVPHNSIDPTLILLQPTQNKGFMATLVLGLKPFCRFSLKPFSRTIHENNDISLSDPSLISHVDPLNDIKLEVHTFLLSWIEAWDNPRNDLKDFVAPEFRSVESYCHLYYDIPNVTKCKLADLWSLGIVVAYLILHQRLPLLYQLEPSLGKRHREDVDNVRNYEWISLDFRHFVHLSGPDFILVYLFRKLTNLTPDQRLTSKGVKKYLTMIEHEINYDRA